VEVMNMVKGKVEKSDWAHVVLPRSIFELLSGILTRFSVCQKRMRGLRVNSRVKGGVPGDRVLASSSLAFMIEKALQRERR
jgi:hypothetical protein